MTVKGKIKILLAFCICILILLLVGIYNDRTNNEFKCSADWIEHTHKITSEAENVLLHVQNAEIAEGKYVITGQAKFLTSFKDEIKNIEDSYFRLKLVVKENTSHQTLIDSLQQAITAKINFSRNVIKV